MKFWVKILVAVCVVVVIAFGVWAFFFREKDEVAAYNRTCELIEYKESTGIKEKLKDLQSNNSIGEGDSAHSIDESTETSQNILNLRKIMFSNDMIVIYDDGGTITCYYDSYYMIESHLDEMIEKLVPFIKQSNGNSKLNRQLKNAVSNYIVNVRELSTAIDILNDCQKTITGNETEMSVLYGNYNSVRQKYRRCLKYSSQLIMDMFDIIKNNYGSIKFDTSLALMDSFARSVNVMCSEEIDKTEHYRAYDAYLISERYYKVENNISIFDDEYNEFDFLKNYNNLFNNYLSVLNKALGKPNLNKTKMATGQDLSDILIEAQDSLVYVLNVLGY